MKSQTNNLNKTNNISQKKSNITSLSFGTQSQELNKTSSFGGVNGMNKKYQEKDQKLLQLKEKLQKQRQNMRKSGQRFRKDKNFQNLSTQIQSGQLQQLQQNGENKQRDSKLRSAGGQSDKIKKLSTTTISTSANTGSLYDFSSIKQQVQMKNKLFMKKNKKIDNVIPTQKSTPLSKVIQQKIYDQPIVPQKNTATKKQQKTQINLMELSAVLEPQKTKSLSKSKKSPQLSSSSPIKQKLSNNSQKKQQKFFQFAKNSTTKAHNQYNSQILANSQVFTTQIQQQKERNKKVVQFLSQIGLESFSEAIIGMGFDQVQTLLEIQVQDMNLLRMRAYQQEKLIGYIKEFKQRNGIEEGCSENELNHRLENQAHLSQRPSTAHFRAKTLLTIAPNKSLTRPSTAHHITPNNLHLNLTSTLENKSSIFYQVGSNQWSIQSQIRKACSECYAVLDAQQVKIKRGDCYYCQKCDPGEFQLDLVSLTDSMVREIRK